MGGGGLTLRLLRKIKNRMEIAIREFFEKRK